MEEKKKVKKKDSKALGPQVIYETEDSLYNSAKKLLSRDSIIVQHKYKIENYLTAASMFEELGEYKDAAELAERCRDMAEKIKLEEKEYIYKLALKRMSTAKGIKALEKTVTLFDSVRDYKDAEILMAECEEKKRKIIWKSRVHVILKVGVLLLIIAAVVWFLYSPFWIQIQEKMIELNQIMSSEMPS